MIRRAGSAVGKHLPVIRQRYANYYNMPRCWCASGLARRLRADEPRHISASSWCDTSLRNGLAAFSLCACGDKIEPFDRRRAAATIALAPRSCAGVARSRRLTLLARGQACTSGRCAPCGLPRLALVALVKLTRVIHTPWKPLRRNASTIAAATRRACSRSSS
jgi:hypothetical protein